MGNKESQFDGRNSSDARESQTLDPSLIRSFTELNDGDNTEFTLERFQIVRLLTNIRQYRLLSGLYERAVRGLGEEKFFWHQLSLSLICDHQFARATKVLQNSIAKAEADAPKAGENLVLEYMQLVRIQIEQLGDMSIAESVAIKAVTRANGSWLSGRCHMLLALVKGLKAQYDNNLHSKKLLVAESIENFERAIQLDPHDDLAHLYCALEYANSCDLEMARELCQTALNLNTENPSAIMLLALIFTARKDYKGALELVINALTDFPSHYGLLVLRLKLEAKYGRIEEALQTSRNLIYFWRKTRFMESFPVEEENLVNGDAVGKMAESLISSSGGRQTFGLASKEAIVPLTPLLTAPLGISATPSAHHLSTLEMTQYPSTDNLSTLGPNAAQSEVGGPPSSDSMSILSSSSKSWISFSAFRLQADIWVELAEFFIEIGRLQDVQACMEEACMIYPNSHQALYLKGHLYLVKAEKCAQADPSLSKRLKAEAKNFIMGAIAICPGHVLSHACLGRLYYSEGNLKMAEKMFRDSISIDPFNARCWHKLGCVLAELGRNDEALECFQASAAMDTSTPLIPFQVIPRLLSTSH